MNTNDNTMNPSAEDAIRAEIASADLSMAVDGSFVETSSSHAARELKKRLDQLLGVGKNGVRSPYALTITQSASGTRVYRVGFRPAAHDGHSLEPQVLSPTADAPSGLLSPLTAINSGATAGLHQRAARLHKAESLLPTSASGYRAVTRVRPASISTGRPSTSTWDVEAERVPLPDDPDEIHRLEQPQPTRVYPGPQYVRLENTDLQIYSRTGDSDIFSSAMGWSDAPRDVAREPRPIGERPFLQLEPGAFPFGRGVIYTKPLSGSYEVRRSSLDKTDSNDDLHERNDTASPTDTVKDSLSTQLKYPTAIFQVLQTYRGIPTLDTLLESHDTPTARLSTTTSAVPENDPRFVIFGDLKSSSDTIIAAGRRKITKPKPGSAPPVSPSLDPSEQRVMMAATIERWVAQLTSELNYDALLDFFLAYRAYVSANDLCHLLICRFHWALEPTTSAQDETVRRIVRVRTFIAFRFWLTTFFQVDFLPNRVLRNEFTSWLNALRKSPMLTAKPDAVLIVQKLKKIVRECKEAHVPKAEPHSPIERTPVEPTPLNLHALQPSVEPEVDSIKKTPASPPRKSSLALPFTRTESLPPSKLASMPMPMHHGPLTRALVNTMGRIGRWKRGLGTRSMMVAGAGASAGCVDPGAFDEFGLSVAQNVVAGAEVVAVRGGVEEYLKMCGLVGREPAVEDGDEDEEGDADGNNDVTVTRSLEPKVEEDKEKGRDTPTSTSTPRLVSQFPPVEGEEVGEEGSLRHSRRASDATQMQLYATTIGSWLPETETISIDDADLSDSSEESEIVRRPPRRLPNRRDLEFAAMRGDFETRSDSVSSLGAPSSVPSVQSVLSASDPTTPDHTGAGIQSWQIDFLGEESDNGDGPGDAEAALQRLEGQIDAEEQRLRDLKVDKWLKRVQELGLQRASGGGILDIAALGINFDDEEEEEGDKPADETEDEPQSISMRPSLEIPSASVTSAPESTRVVSEAMSSHQMHDSAPHSLHESTSHLLHDTPSPRQRLPPPQFKKGRGPKDTSFLLQHRSEVIAHNLSAIERGLFMAISFEELVMHNWGPQGHELDVTDWMQYRTDAAQHRIQPSVQKEGGRDVLTSDVLAVRARFNLTVQFVASEVVLAHPTQRVVLVNKLIRIAWKLYGMNNFATLCAIIVGLTSVWVNQAMKRLWQNVGMWEMRLFKDLKWFTSSTDNFRFMRDAIMLATHGNQIETPSDRGSEQMVGCIPFLGIYLSELSDYAKLPDFIDPTRPEEPIQFDPTTGEFGDLHDPEVFSTLPELPDCMPIRPLLNLHKQRQIAGVVNALVRGQHMASACRFTVEQKVYSKCLRLKCVDAATLSSALAAES